MANSRKGGFIYFFTNRENEIKFGETINDPIKSYKQSSRYTPHSLNLEGQYFFKNATKKDLKKIESEIRNDPIIKERIMPNRRDWVRGVPVDYLDQIVSEKSREWQTIQNQLCSLREYNASLYEAVINCWKAIDDEIFLSNQTSINSESSENFASDHVKTVCNRNKILSILKNSVNIKYCSKKSKHSSPITMTELCEMLGLEKCMNTYKTVSNFFKKNEIQRRRSNGRNLYDLALV